MNAIDELFTQARLAHQNGQLARAETGYRQVLLADPSHCAAWYLLGVACQSLGKLPESVDSLRKALRLRPDYLEAQNHLGVVLAQCGEMDEAAACFRRTLHRRPDFFDAQRNLALALEALGRTAEAMDAYRRAIEIRPDSVDAYRNLARSLRKAGSWDEAVDVTRRALRVEPGAVDLHNDLGSLLEKNGRYEEAVASYREAIRLEPALASAHSNLAAALGRQEKLEQAVAACREALRLKPDYAGAKNNLGVLLEKQEKWEEACACYQGALGLDPGFVEALYNLGSVLGKLGRFEEAEAACRQAIARKPDACEAYHNMGVVLAERGRYTEAAASYRQALRIRPDFVDSSINLASVLAKCGELDQAEECCRHAIALRPERGDAHSNLGFTLVEQGRTTEAIACYQEALRLKPDSPTVLSSYLYCLNYEPSVPPDLLLTEHRRWSRFQDDAGDTGPSRAHDRDPGRPLRVGYVSPDFRLHPVACFLQPILQNHEPTQVEAVGYAEVSAPDATTARLRSLVREWRVTSGMTDEQVAALVRRDRIDILVDLAGHTAHNRLGVFAGRPAPVQVTYLGYPGTTGLTTIDYILTDAVADPIDAPAWSTEKPFRLPGGFCCFAPPENAPEVSSLPALRNGYVTFGSFHKMAKLNSSVLDLWSDLLLSVPATRLLLLRNNLRGKRREEILAHFVSRGVAVDRITMTSDVGGNGGHLKAYHSIDIALDVFPWCGHTTACEGMWMGVPIVTLVGDRHAQRMTASVLSSLGLEAWVAQTREQYLERCRNPFGDWQGLARWRAELRPLMLKSRLCDGPNWTRGLEAAYRTMWKQSCDATH